MVQFIVGFLVGGFVSLGIYALVLAGTEEDDAKRK